MADHVEQRIDDADKGRLVALIVANTYKDLLLVAEVPVDAANDHMLRQRAACHALRGGHARSYLRSVRNSVLATRHRGTGKAAAT